MKIINIKKYKQKRNTVLSADILLDNNKSFNAYFEVDSKYSDLVDISANAFIPVGLPIAMKTGENLEISDVASSKLFNNLRGVSKELIGWNEGFKKIKIKSSKLVDSKYNSGYSACFFSAGADSFYTYLKNKKTIKYLIFVHGFDIDIENNKLFRSVKKNIEKIKNDEDVEIIYLRTNIRKIFEKYFNWDMSHEFALASVSLLFGNSLKNVFASCGVPNPQSDHHYMTPEIDALWKTESMNVIHYGCDADKEYKLKYLSKNVCAMNNLRVCWLNKENAYNCSECQKCFRNMLALYSTNSLSKCKTFNQNINLEILKKTNVDDYNIKYFISILETLDSKKDSGQVREALDACIRRNMNKSRLNIVTGKIREEIRYIDKKYNQNRLYWTLARGGLIH